MTKAIAWFVAAFVVVIMAAKFASGLSMDTGDAPANEAWAQNKMEFVAWNEGRWTAWIHDGAFELLPQDTRNWHRHSSPGIAFIGWDGEPWQAKVDGDAFRLAKHGNWQGTVVESHAIRYLDWQGGKRLRTVAELAR